jgi:hypothetical protein
VADKDEAKGKLSFFEFLVRHSSKYDKIHITRAIPSSTSQNVPTETVNTQIFEFKQKLVLFGQSQCKLLILKDISELVSLEYARSL